MVGNPVGLRYGSPARVAVTDQARCLRRLRTLRRSLDQQYGLICCIRAGRMRQFQRTILAGKCRPVLRRREEPVGVPVRRQLRSRCLRRGGCDSAGM